MLDNLNPFNKKKKWQEELNNISNNYIELINELSREKSTIDNLDIILSKRYKFNGLIFTGQQIIDEIRKKLSADVNYSYEFKTVDDRPIITRDYRIFTDDKIKAKVNDMSFEDRHGNIHKIKNDNVLVTIEDLKSKYMGSLIEIDKLKKIISDKEDENHKLFLDIIESSGGLYKFAVNKKLILMMSRVLKELNYYNKDSGVEHSFGRLNDKQKLEVIEEFYKKIYK